MLEQPSEPDWSSLYFPPRNNTDTGDRGDDGDVEQDVVYSKRTPFDNGRVDPAANDLMRALFLPIFSCPLNDDPGAHPLCASVYKAQARDAWVAYYHESNRLNALLETQMMGSAELRRLLADTQDMHMNGEEFHASRIKDLRSRLDKSEFELSEIAKQKQAVDARVTQIEEQKGCDARIVEALGSVTAQTLVQTINRLNESGTCGPEQTEQATKLLTEAAELRELRKQRDAQEEVERNKEEQARKKKEEKLRGMTQELAFLETVYHMMVKTGDDFSDKDHEDCGKDVVAFAQKRFKIKPEGDKPTSLSYLELGENTEVEKIYRNILELIVQKAGKIRMMVRFRDKPITRQSKQISVKESYAIGTYGGNNIFEQKDEFDMYFATLSEEEKNIEDFEKLKTEFDKMSPNEKPYVNTPFVGYRLDSSEYENLGVYRTLLASKGTGTTEIGLKADGEIQRLSFERVFFDESQEKVFDSLRSFVWSANHTKKPMGIFAYGGTGSGKTHTLIGTEENPGVLTRLLEEQIKPDMHSESIEVQIFETHPRRPVGSGKNLDHRVIDLIGLSNNTGVIFDDSNKMNINQGEVVYFDMEKTVNGTTGLRMKARTISDIADLYEGDKKDNDMDQRRAAPRILNPKSFRQNSKSLRFTTDDEKDGGQIVDAVKRVLKYRRTESTDGNQDGSSRSHLVVSIKVKIIGEEVPKKFFVVDMAGKEALFKNDKKPVSGEGTFARRWGTSEGINQSLDAFTRYLALTKCKLSVSQKSRLSKFSLRNQNTIVTAHNVDEALKSAYCVVDDEDAPQRMPHLKDTKGAGSYVDSNAYETFNHIRYDDDPLFFLTDDIWSDEDSKVMMFACVYPLTKSYSRPGLPVPQTWNDHFNELGEKLYDKFKRDLGVLREMDYVQRIKKYDIPPKKEPEQKQPRRSKRLR